MSTEAMLRALERAVNTEPRGEREYLSAEFIRRYGPALAEVVRDAQRYKHLRDQHDMEGFWIAHGKFGEGCSRWNGEAADKAIDAARGIG